MTVAATTWVPMATDGTVMRNAFAAFSAALTAVGIVKTADTGQIDLTPSSITLPATVNSSVFAQVGYEIRKMEASGKPTVYFKVFYGVMATTANQPSNYRASIYMQMSTATDGAGTITGIGPYTSNFPSGTTMPAMSTSARNLYMASDGANYLTIVSDPSEASSIYGPFNHCFERSINPLTGAYDAEAVVLFGPFASSGNRVALINFVSGSGAFESNQTPFALTGIYTSSGSLSTAIVMPIVVAVPTPKGPPTSMLIAYSADVTRGGQYQINMYGQSHNYIAAQRPYSASIGAVGNYSVLMRYD